MFRGALATVCIWHAASYVWISTTKTEPSLSRQSDVLFFYVEVTVMVANVEVQSALEALANVHQGAS